MTNEEKALATKSRATYFRQWRQKNPDKARGYQEKYWLKKAMELQAQEA